MRQYPLAKRSNRRRRMPTARTRARADCRLPRTAHADGRACVATPRRAVLSVPDLWPIVLLSTLGQLFLSLFGPLIEPFLTAPPLNFTMSQVSPNPKPNPDLILPDP